MNKIESIFILKIKGISQIKYTYIIILIKLKVRDTQNKRSNKLY